MQKSSKKTTMIRWFPPSWLLIETEGQVMYIDPAWIQKNFDTYPEKVIFSHYPKPMDGLPEPDLPKADIILITHHHQDHVKTATIGRLATANTKIYAPVKCAKLIGREFNEVKPGDEIIDGNITVKVVYAYNTPEGKSTHKAHHKGECVGYLLNIGRKTIYHAGDTDIIPEMKHLGEVEIAFLPIGGTFTMDAKEATKASELINPRVTIPMHFLKTKPEVFEKAMLGKGKVKKLHIGQAITL